MTAQRFPILIVCFNRPDYLRQVLASLRAQKGVELDERRIFLLQDGAVDVDTGRLHCKPRLIEDNMAAFTEAFPGGHVLASTFNLGVAGSLDRAERLAFEQLGAEAAVFLEDDLWLGPYYLKTLDRLLGFALDNPRIGYVAAYGMHLTNMEGYPADGPMLRPLHHHWGFGLTRRQWLRQRPFVEAYLDIALRTNYRRRDHARIVQLFHGWGFDAPGTSQDIAKAFACILTGVARINTVPCYGKYIGAEGVHQRAAVYEEAGYSNTVVVDKDDFPSAAPTTSRVHKILIQNAELGRRDLGYAALRPSNEHLAQLRAQALWEHTQAIKRYNDPRGYEAAVEHGAARFPRYLDEAGEPRFVKEVMRCKLERADIRAAKTWSETLKVLTGEKNPCANLVFARHYQGAGQAEEARRYWAAILDVRPDHEEAQRWLAHGQATSGTT